MKLVNSQPILLAEDNEHDAVFFKNQLTAAKIFNPLQILTNGEQVIDYLNGSKQYADRTLYPLPIVIFLDLRMPKIGGLLVLGFLQVSDLLRRIPVIVLSVLGDIKEVNEAYQRGAKTFLLKPLNASDLSDTLRGIPGIHLKPENEGFVLARTEQPPASPGIAAALEKIFDQGPGGNRH